MTREPFLGLRGSRLTWGITCCSASCFLLFGYDQGIMGSIINTPYFLNAIGLDANDAGTLSTVVAIYDVGCMTGCLLAALTGYTFGRKRMIWAGCTIMILGTILQATSYSVSQMIAGRVVTGIGNGLNSGTVPTWVSECAKPKSRGKHVTAQLSIAAFGIVVAYWTNYGFFHATGQIVWRFPIALQAVFAIITIIGLFWLPESPRYLYAKGRKEEADVVLACLKDADVNDEVVVRERAEILEAIKLEDELGGFSWKSLVWDESGQKIPQRLALVIAIQALQELPGLNMVFYYSSFIFIQLGIVPSTALILGGVTSACFWLGSVCGIPLIERLGRKRLLHLGTIPSLIGYAIYLPMVKDGRPTQLWVAFGATCLICFAYGYSWLPVPWVLGPELLPVRYRHIGGAMNAFSNWTFTFIIVKVGPIGLTNIKWRLYIVFLVFTVCQLVCVQLFYPETKGLTLEQIDTLFIKDAEVVTRLQEKADEVRNIEDSKDGVTVNEARQRGKAGDA